MRSARVVMFDRTPLVFGMDWIPLLGDADEARAHARSRGASHYILSGNPAAAMGLAGALPKRGPFWSVAELFARCHPRGTAACIVALDENSWYVLACHEGVVLARADRCHSNVEQARRTLESLRIAYPRLEVLEPGDINAEHGELARLAQLAAAVPPLTRLPSRKPWLVGGVAVLALLAWGGGHAMREAPAAADTAAEARHAWSRAVDQAMAGRWIHGEEGTKTLLDDLYRQPAIIAGWALRTVQCRPRAESVLWSCVGEYHRVAGWADNRGLLAAAPDDWRLVFPGLDHARADWTLALPGIRPDRADLAPSAALSRDWASALQAVLPAFRSLRLDPSRRLDIPAPELEGKRPAPPADLPRLGTRSIRVEGPLRSSALLMPLARAVSWRKAVLSFEPAAVPGVRSSRLELHLEGEAYERS